MDTRPSHRTPIPSEVRRYTIREYRSVVESRTRRLSRRDLLMIADIVCVQHGLPLLSICQKRCLGAVWRFLMNQVPNPVGLVLFVPNDPAYGQ